MHDRGGLLGLRIGRFGKYFSLDSERNLNGSGDPTADRSFIQLLGPDFGFWLLGKSDRGNRGPQCSRRNLTFSLLCAGCHAVGKMTLLA